MKYINFKRYKFSTIEKNFDKLKNKFVGIFQFLDIKRYNLRKISKYLDFKRLTSYKFSTKKLIEKYRYIPLYFFVFVILIGFGYLVIPTFYSYDKSIIEKTICKSKNFECLIKGDVNYTFYPTPRIKIKDLVINDLSGKKNNLMKVGNVEIKLFVNNLLVKEKQNFKNLRLSNFEIYFNLKDLKKYKNIFSQNINFIPTTFKKGKIIFFDNEENVANIENVNLNLKFKEDTFEAKLVGQFLNDEIYINLNTDKIENTLFTNIILKFSNLNLLTKANFSNSAKDKNIKSGKALIKKDKHKITAIFDYSDNKLRISKSNLSNPFAEGSLEGVITLLPYFSFDLDLNLNNINFTKLYSSFLSLDEKTQRELFKINNKLNGKINLSTNKVYSSYNLIKSFESRLQFVNGNILIDQFLFNLGKLGAADVIGIISSDKKFTNFKFESNIFVDNQKKFLRKFGIYNTKTIFTNLFVSGNFDLYNLKSTFYEIFDDKKMSNENVNFVEKEFNYFMLDEGYQNLFRFPKFKEFVKSISGEIN